MAPQVQGVPGAALQGQIAEAQQVTRAGEDLRARSSTGLSQVLQGCLCCRCNNHRCLPLCCGCVTQCAALTATVAAALDGIGCRCF